MTVTSASVSVIVVEDEKDLREEVVDFLSGRGMAVRAAANGAELDRLLADASADVVVLDLGLPTEDGTTVAARMRARSDRLGIVMMTARGRVEERILGYDSGADVYLVKPVDFGELVAAIHAVSRAKAHVTSTASVAASDLPQLAWQLDLSSWRLAAPSGAAVRLTRSEAQLLECLVEHPGEPVSRDVIGMRMGKVADLGEHRYVDQVVRRLRRKITCELGWEAPIGAAHNQGYYFIGPVAHS